MANEIITKCGGKICIFPDDNQVSLVFFPPEGDGEIQNDSMVLDIYQVGLKRKSITRLISAIGERQRFVSLDGNFFLDASSNVEWRVGFKNHHYGRWHECDVQFFDFPRMEAYLNSVLSLEPESVAVKTGRNEPCPCGSGAKYKKCCMREGSSLRTVTEVETLPPQVENLLMGCQDLRPVVAADLKSTPDWEIDSMFWYRLGASLSACGRLSEGEKALRKALEINPSSSAARIDLAANLTQMGRPSDALELLNFTPNTGERYHVIRANALQNLARHVEAVDHYRVAIKEEPEFYLPVARILKSLKVIRSDEYEFWLNYAVTHFKDSVWICLEYADACFISHNFQLLEEAYWIDEVVPSLGDDGTNIKQTRADINEKIDSVGIAKFYRFAAIAINRLLAFKSLRNENARVIAISAFRESLARLPREKHLMEKICEPLKVLLYVASELGLVFEAEKTAEHVCPECRSCRVGLLGSINTYLARARLNFGDAQGAVDLLVAEPNDERDTAFYFETAARGYAELGKSKETISQLNNLDERWPTPNGKALAGELCLKIGYYTQAEKYFNENIGSEEPSLLCFENLITCKFIESDFKGSKDIWNKYFGRIPENIVQITNSQGSGSLAYIDLRELKSEHFELIHEEASRIKGHFAYTLQLLDFVNALSPAFGSGAGVRTELTTMNEVLAAARSGHEGMALIAEHTAEVARRQRGDHSSLVARVEDQIPKFRQFPDGAQVSYIESQLKIDDGISVDYAPCVVSSAKSLEISLKRLVFDRFHNRVSHLADFSGWLVQADGPDGGQVGNLSKFMKTGGYLELGGMLHALRLANGRTGEKLALLANLKSFIIKELKAEILFQDSFLAAADLIGKARNAAAHEKTYSRQDAVDLHAKTAKVLSLIANDTAIISSV